MTSILNTPPSQLKMDYIEKELQGMRSVLDYLYDGEMATFAILNYIKETYVDWADILMWLKKNQLKGKSLVEFFQNESPDGGGYLMGMETILSRMNGTKNFTSSVKLSDLT